MWIGIDDTDSPFRDVHDLYRGDPGARGSRVQVSVSLTPGWSG